MRKISAIWTVLGFFLLTPALALMDASISGDYVEVRTSDIYTGPCFANSEMNLTGKEAILAWRVQEGSWQGVSLQGLSVVAVVKAKATLGDPYATPYPARSVLLVDQRANARQQKALVGFARSMTGELLEDVVEVTVADIDFSLDAALGEATVQAGRVARLETRALNHHDHLCGNEIVYYPPLADAVSAEPAYTKVHEFSGQGLNSQWSSPFKRSAFVGHFQR